MHMITEVTLVTSFQKKMHGTFSCVVRIEIAVTLYFTPVATRFPGLLQCARINSKLSNVSSSAQIKRDAGASIFSLKLT